MSRKDFKNKMKKLGRINAKRAGRMEIVLNRIARRSGSAGAALKEQVAAPVQPQTPTPRVIIFKSELDYLSRCILDRPDIETGGQLFGYFTREGIPVVMYVIGPGPKANHKRAAFNQDIQYLVAVGEALKQRYGLAHIGEWHSHHRIALARPSGQDVDTMTSSTANQGLGRVLLFIGNLRDSGTTVNAFLCDEKTCRFVDWDIIYSCSPVRPVADRSLERLLIHPLAAKACHTDARMVSLDGIPDYASGYWLEKKGSGFVMKSMMDYLKRRNPGASVHALLNERGEACILVEAGRYIERIVLSMGFPVNAPAISRTSSGRALKNNAGAVWDYRQGDIYTAFTRYYETI